ncbi:hypothetical protein [Novosphingobium sp. FSW06-99]|uniref:hypothetical protein n=1 Tax=Novosphingobium sp. FSW06-99 TaxID=1739113 RepID=UPI0012E35DE3|nr:hypothetical protein [Novosphingobium sp. FSW06-99]
MKEKVSKKLARAPFTTEELVKMTAAEFGRQRLTDDEKSRLRAINEQRARRRLEWSAQLRAEEEPILADLQTIGCDVKSVWDLVNTSRPYPDAIPILLKHLTKSYSDRTKEGIARALAVSDARDAWPLLVAEYLKAPMGEVNGIRLGAKSGLAAALSAVATDDVISQLAALAKDKSNGDSRLLLLSALRRSKMPVAKNTLEELADDPSLKKEIASWKKVRGKPGLV